jgi:hypothetical protein
MNKFLAESSVRAHCSSPPSEDSPMTCPPPRTGSHTRRTLCHGPASLPVPPGTGKKRAPAPSRPTTPSSQGQPGWHAAARALARATVRDQGYPHACVTFLSSLAGRKSAILLWCWYVLHGRPMEILWLPTSRLSRTTTPGHSTHADMI